jgi:hypothetical protein
MSNTTITNVQTSDTFQSWINKTNELIDLVNDNVLLAGPGPGFTVTGNSTLQGSFSANTITANTSTANTSILSNIRKLNDINDYIVAESPVRIQTGVNNIFDLQSTSGNRPIIRMINGGNARWVLQLNGSASGSAFSIQTEGTSNPQLNLTQAGRLTATEFVGDGFLITNLRDSAIPNLNASKITAGTFDVARIPNLDASKITTGTFNINRVPTIPDSKLDTVAASRLTGTILDARIPNLNASKITAGIFNVDRIPDLPASRITSETFNDARIPNTIVRTSRTLIAGTGINISGNGDLSANRTISAVLATQAQAENGTNSTNLMTPLRTKNATDALTPIVKSTTVTAATFSTSSTVSFVEIPNLSVTIIPATINNKVLVTLFISYGQADNQGTALRITRNGIDIGIGAADGSKTRVTAELQGVDQASNQYLFNSSITLLDSPGTTLPCEYKVFVRRLNKTAVPGDFFLNKSSIDTNNANFCRGISTITAMQVAP